MHPLFAMLLLISIVAAQFVVVAAMSQITAPKMSPVVVEEDRSWVHDIGPRGALSMVERELRTISSRTPLPLHAGDEGSWEVRYRACRRHLQAIAKVLMDGEPHQRAIAHLLNASPPSGTQMSTNVKAYAANRLVRDALDHLWDDAAA